MFPLTFRDFRGDDFTKCRLLCSYFPEVLRSSYVRFGEYEANIVVEQTNCCVGVEWFGVFELIKCIILSFRDSFIVVIHQHNVGVSLEHRLGSCYIDLLSC